MDDTEAIMFYSISGLYNNFSTNLCTYKYAYVCIHIHTHVPTDTKPTHVFLQQINI